MGPVIWITIFIKHLSNMFTYMDDSFSFDVDGNVLWYEPYHCYYPAKQVKLLKLWDGIGLPHEKAKQEYGRQLRITGFLVDPNEMRVTMDDEDHGKLIQHVSDFVQTASGGMRRTLHEFQQLAGWINWSLNVYPLLKPALSNVYDKISSKSQPHTLIFVSKAVTDDMSWFISHVECSYGIRVFKATDWSADEADVTAYGDASGIGMGFYFAESKSGFQSVLPHDRPRM
jgi:hypothetical protein